jgi:hypothetical protein
MSIPASESGLQDREEEVSEEMRNLEELLHFFPGDWPPSVWVSAVHSVGSEAIGLVDQSAQIGGSPLAQADKTPEVMNAGRLHPLQSEEALDQFLHMLLEQEADNVGREVIAFGELLGRLPVRGRSEHPEANCLTPEVAHTEPSRIGQRSM